MEKQLISICGDNCTVCPRYIATMNDNTEDLQKLAELWYRLGFRDKIVTAVEMKCHGCRKDKTCSHHLNTCEHLKNLNNCGECDFFSCEKLEMVFRKTEGSEAVCREKCNEEEFDRLRNAFFLKREILNGIHLSFRKQERI